MSDNRVELSLSELGEGELTQVTVGGEPVCVARTGGKVYAVADQCSHVQIPLSDGSLEGRQVVCPWHGAMFDLETGRPTCGPATEPVKCYAARVEGDVIVVED